MAQPAENSFFVGVNYPWVNYGQDFGQTSSGHRGVSLPEISEKVAKDFAGIRGDASALESSVDVCRTFSSDAGVHAARIF